MYQEHSSCIQPVDVDVKVWRYVDFTKLISLIDSKCLFFARSDKFSDPFEGALPRNTFLARETLPEFAMNSLTPELVAKIRRSLRQLGEHFKYWRRYTAINCWHMNEHESAAMWSLYLKSNEGVAIQSTYSKLKKSLIDENDIHLGLVKYLDYEVDSIGPGDQLAPFFHKRKSFEHEREVRALSHKYPATERDANAGVDTMEYGMQIKVDLETLIEKIYVSPNAPSWFSDLMQSAINIYGYKFEVVQSKLNESPLF